MARAYNKLPTEILALDPFEFYLNLSITFPEAIEKQKRAEDIAAAEAALGYQPIKKLLENFKRAA